jgi:hypothetical protein
MSGAEIFGKREMNFWCDVDRGRIPGSRMSEVVKQ